MNANNADQLQKTNNELKLLPGYFFYPKDKTDLIELSLHDRMNVMANQGIYTVGMVNLSDTKEAFDLYISLDNSRIPTHKRADAVFPGLNNVPLCLGEYIYTN